MFELEMTNRFRKSYKKLHPNEQKAIKDSLVLLADSTPFHPSLRTKSIQGTKAVFEASVNMDIRISWEYHSEVENTLLLRNCGHHDELLNKP